MGNPTQYKVYFTSDTHFAHKNILKYGQRRRELLGITLDDLTNNTEDVLSHHDEWLVDMWNSTVKRGDFVYILGDFCLGTKEYAEKILGKLKGRKYLILGNHDKSCKGLERYFEWVGDIKEVKFTHEVFPFIDENETFCCELCHYPLLTWNRRTHGSVMVHGHCHGSIDYINTGSKELRVDVGIDSELAQCNLVPLERLYGYFKDISHSAECSSFQEYANKLMERQGFRM